jgi:DNA-binding SARP family transcriptional activator/tetratricopeptide (TPR) repeat protein
MGTNPSFGLSFGVLGPLEVRAGDVVIPLSAGKLRVVLATLLISANRLVPATELIERLWGSNPPATARATLATYVMRLRRELTAPIAEPAADPIQTRPEGYLLEVEADRLDLLHFTRLLADARRYADQPATELALLYEALALWRGPALVDAPSESLQRDVVPRLEEQRLRTIERRIDLELADGLHAELIGELTALTAEHRLRERTWCQLMIALYRCGRQADALEAFARLRSWYVEDLGLEPGSEIRRLQEQILAGDPALDLTSPEPAADAEPEPERPVSWVPRCQLPPAIGDFVGRATLVEEVLTRLGSSLPGTAPDSARHSPDDVAGAGPGLGSGSPPIVVISGTPGSGKSTLAIRVAHRLRQRYPDGQLFVRLDGAGPAPRDPSDVLAELLIGSGLPPDDLPEGVDARAAVLRARLADRQVLVVLDDAAGTNQVLPLLPGTSSCAVLVTSRRRLADLPGAWSVRPGAFGTGDALDLLTRMLGPQRVAAEALAAREIADACGGLPLALRIVGARLATRPSAGLEGLAARLSDEKRRLDELRSGDLEVRSSLALSYQGLVPGAALAFRRLGLLGSIDVPAWAVGVLADESDGERLVEQLMEASLLSEAGLDPTGEPRYRLHDLLVVYAAELAASDPPADNRAAIRRYVETLLVLTDRAYDNLVELTFDEIPMDSLPPVEAVVPDSEVDRLTRQGAAWFLAEQAQLDWAIHVCAREGWCAEASQLLDRSMSYLDTYLVHDRVLELHELVRDACRLGGEERLSWRAEWGRAMQLATRGLTDTGLELQEACVAAFEKLGASCDLAHALAALAHFRSLRGATDVALALAERAVAAARESGYEPTYASTLRELAKMLSMNGDYARALALFEETLEIARRLGQVVDKVQVLHYLAEQSLAHGDLARAGAASDECLALVDDLNDHRGAAFVTSLASRVAVARKEYGRAVQLAGQAKQRFDRLGDRFGAAGAAASLAEAYLAAGRTVEAVELVEQALQEYADVGTTQYETRLQAVRLAAEELLGT